MNGVHRHFANSVQVRTFVTRIINEFELEMFGLQEVARLCLVALCTGGHVLLEGNPGLGKTQLVKTLHSILSLPYGRIQFTPDLMPSDITGTQVPDFQGGNPQAFKFQHGPIFKSLLLADEINRASPKTQAALLEAMAEKEATILGTTYLLPGGEKKNDATLKAPRLPFMVLATQNPIDHEGTYDLPEAQLDRFMFKIIMPALALQTIDRILEKTTQRPRPIVHEIARESTDNLRDMLLEIQTMILDLKAGDPVKQHVTNLLLASNGQLQGLQGISSQNGKLACQLAAETIRFGGGPRMATALMLGAKAWALLFSANDCALGQDLLPVALATLRHRLKLAFDWKENYVKWRKSARNQTLSDAHPRMHDMVLLELCLLTAPDEARYPQPFEEAFREALKS